MNQTQEIELAKQFYDKCFDILKKKAHDYAQEDDCFSNFKKIASICEVPTSKVFIMFMTVKIARLVELTKKGESQTGESMQDSCLDIANYGCLMSLYLGEDYEN